MNVASRLQHRMDSQPDTTAIVGPDGTEVSFGAVGRQARAVAAWLDTQGLGDSDRVAVYLPDTLAYIPTMLGIWQAGAIASPINTRFGLEELEFTLSDLGPAALIGSDAFEENVTALQDRIDGLDESTTLFIDRGGSFADEALPDATAAPEIARKLDDAPAVVMYTSGTTGHPKGVVQTHRNVGAQLDVNITHFGVDSDDTTLVSVPLFHVGGLYGGALPTMLSGGTMVIQGPWDAETWAAAIERHEVTFGALIPTMMVDALNTPEARERDTSSLELFAYGGSPAPVEVLDSFAETFGVDDLRNYYGQTENTGLSVTYGPGVERKPALTGRPVNAVEHRLVDVGADGLVDVEPGEEGELVLRGDIITPGYWDESLDEDYFTDGWLHTDDVFRQDADGLLYYVDRVDDMIISGGENVAPSEVENALQKHSSIEAVAVFGTDHERLGEVVTAAIVSSDSELTEESLEAWWTENAGLAGYKRPRRTEFVEEFPRTATQKIDKVSLRAQVSD